MPTGPEAVLAESVGACAAAATELGTINTAMSPMACSPVACGSAATTQFLATGECGRRQRQRRVEPTVLEVPGAATGASTEGACPDCKALGEPLSAVGAVGTVDRNRVGDRAHPLGRRTTRQNEGSPSCPPVSIRHVSARSSAGHRLHRIRRSDVGFDNPEPLICALRAREDQRLQLHRRNDRQRSLRACTLWIGPRIAPPHGDGRHLTWSPNRRLRRHRLQGVVPWKVMEPPRTSKRWLRAYASQPRLPCPFPSPGPAAVVADVLVGGVSAALRPSAVARTERSFWRVAPSAWAIEPF